MIVNVFFEDLRYSSPVARTKLEVPVLADDEPCCAPVRAESLSEADAAQLSGWFAALGDPIRLRLLSLIASAPGGEMCTCDMTEPVGRSQPTVSHHLKILLEAGLVERDKRGLWAWYRVVPARLEALRAVLA